MNQVKLESVCDIKNGYAFKSTEFLKEGIPLLRISSFDNGPVKIDKKTVYVNQNNLVTKSDFKVEKGDILIALSGATTGKYGIYTDNEPSLLNQRVGLLKSGKATELSGKYFYYYLSILQTEIFRKAGGAAQPNISTKAIGEMLIPLPPLEQQKKIASILDAADTYRQKTKALIAKYDELTQSLFLDMFGDPVKNEKGWEVIDLKKLTTKIGSGNTPKGGSDVYVEKGITFFRSQNVWKNRIIYKDIAFIDQETHNKMTNSSLKHKDILITKTGRFNTENSSLGRAAIYLGEDDQANVNGHVYLIRLKNDVAHEFVLHILTSRFYQEHIRRVCVGGIDKRQLNKNHIEDFPIISPPVRIQKTFLARLLLIHTDQDQMKVNLEKADTLFNSLLQKAFKGDLV